MASIPRDIFVENSPASRGFISLLGLVCFQPRKFFRHMDKTPMKYSVIMAALILALVSFSAIQQADLSANAVTYELEEEFLPEDDGMEPMALTRPSDPSQNWMTGLSAAGKQAIYWIVLTIVLSEVSLFKGKAPNLEHNLQIAVWASLPFAMMAAIQILFVMGGGKISEIGFTGFLDEWQSYYELHPYLQSAVYAFAAHFNFFTLWNFVLLYKGARESLRGNRLVVSFVLISWLMMLILAFGYEHYQNASQVSISDASDDYYDYEYLPEDESWMDEPLYTEPENELSGEEFP